MAFDKNDKADQKILKDAVDAALAEANEEHEAATEGLKTKNAELLGKLKDARKGNADPAAIERLEAEIERLTTESKTATKTIKTLTAERDTLKTTAENEAATSRKLTVDQGLTEALTGCNVPAHFMPAVKKLLGEKVEVKTDGEKRSLLVDGKPLGEFVKTWSQGDEGKHYVTAPANGGSNAPGGKAPGNGTAKVIPYADYEASPAGYAKELANGSAVLGPQTATA